MSRECQNCGEIAVDEGVCTACGVVNEEGGLIIDYDFSCKFNDLEKPFKRSQSICLISGLDTLQRLAEKFAISDDERIKAESLLKAIFSNRDHKRKPFGSKEQVSILAGCCLMNLEDKYKNGLTPLKLCSFFGCNKSKVSKMIKCVKKHLVENTLNAEESDDIDEPINKEMVSEENSANLDTDKKSLRAYVEDLLSHFPEDIKDELIHRTALLTELAEKMWLLSGRSKVGLVVGAAYLCLKSIDQQRFKMTLKKFCSEYHLNPSTAATRIPELKDMLLKLGQQICPSIKNYVTRQNLLYHLEDILENSESYRNDLNAYEFRQDVIAKKEFTQFRRKAEKNEPPCAPTVEYPEDMNASDIEISDTEISSYIRTEEQVNLVKELKEKYQKD